MKKRKGGVWPSSLRFKMVVGTGFEPVRLVLQPFVTKEDAKSKKGAAHSCAHSGLGNAQHLQAGYGGRHCPHGRSGKRVPRRSDLHEVGEDTRAEAPDLTQQPASSFFDLAKVWDSLPDKTRAQILALAGQPEGGPR